ncbi:TetR/AcrR family transcriptional regulator [Oceanicola sp. 22II-s10i]|uniref:TetR/AcrR family transcriptional regulator n=1 Tax=Oceanicola sp. 22II-s10i TaxID=1317116 RepID=UPI000B5289F6|nr:TetR/AcrR family transcriptional regulator [Oceanicola sp. 22II-s10i]
MARHSIANGEVAFKDVGTRDRILLASARLFRYNGLHTTTLREVARETGITVGSIYNHFASKEEILDEVLRIGVENVAANVRDRVAALPETATGRERIATAIHEHLLTALHQGDFTSANIRLWAQLPPEVKRRQRKVRREYAEYWRSLFRSAQEAGELNPHLDVTVMELFVVGAINWTGEWYDPRRGSFDAFCNQLLAMIFDGLAVAPDGEAPTRDGEKWKRTEKKSP